MTSRLHHPATISVRPVRAISPGAGIHEGDHGRPGRPGTTRSLVPGTLLAGNHWRPILWSLPPLLIVLGIAVYPILRVLTESVHTQSGTGTAVWSQVLG